MAELKKASDGDTGFGEAGETRRESMGGKGHTKLLYVTPEMLVKNGKLASALEALACRCCEECVACWPLVQIMFPSRIISFIQLLFFQYTFDLRIILFKGCEMSLCRATAVDQRGFAVGVVENFGAFRRVTPSVSGVW